MPLKKGNGGEKLEKKTIYGIFAKVINGEKVYRIYEGAVTEETDERIKADFGLLSYEYDRTAEGTTFFYSREEAEKRQEYCESFAAVRIKEYFEQK